MLSIMPFHHVFGPSFMYLFLLGGASTKDKRFCMYLHLRCLLITRVLCCELTRNIFLFSVTVSECCFRTLIAFLLLALRGVPSDLLEAFPGVANLVPGGVLLPVLYLLREIIDNYGL